MTPMPDYPFIRQIRSPLTVTMLEPLDPRCRVVQFDGPLSEDDYRTVNRFMGGYPHVALRVYGDYQRQIADLEFLRWFPEVTRFQVDLFELDNWDGLRHLSSNLDYIGLGATRKRMSLRLLARYPRLKRLFLEGHDKDINVVGSLMELEDVTLRSITLPDLSLLLPLERLWSLDIKLGGTKELGLLPEFKGLKYLELWQIKGLCNLNPISGVRSLQHVFLQSLRQVEVIPSLRQLDELRRVTLITMKGVRDISPLATAAALEEIGLYDMPQLRPEDFRPLKDLQTLHRLSIGLGSKRKNEAVHAMFPELPVGPLPRFEVV